MDSTIEFEEVVKVVSKINQNLRDKHFSAHEIDAFWSKMIALIPKIKEVGIENIKICTGCGHLNIEEIKPTALACCPDNSYVNIKDKN
ncbi:hypothetical protein [Gaetbulibacter sp. PBL-D1]|uniref:hypothetical protein n=1 Tax=Gaetbulibacter sp. PBL-D1 TaxID=3422594 RepID=UPI003D2F0B3F